MFEINVTISNTNWNSKISTHAVVKNINLNMCLNFESEWSTFDMQKGRFKLKSSVHFGVLSHFWKQKDSDLQEIVVIETLKVM